MPKAQTLQLQTTGVDLNKLVDFNPSGTNTRWRVIEGSKRNGQRGRLLGTICLRHAGGYEVVLELDDGRIDTFSPMALMPEPVSESNKDPVP